MFNSLRHGRFLRHLTLASLYAVATVTATAEETPPFQIHEWSVWLAESNLKQLNSKHQYSSLMPGIVDSARSRTQQDAKKPLPSPLSIIATYGQPPKAADIDVRLKSGRFLAHWPPADLKANRLRWFELKISEPSAETASLANVPDDHWFQRARQLASLHLGGMKRPERFLCYDAEAELPLTVRLEGGPDSYQLVSLGTSELRDLLLIVPTEQGRRVGWLDQLGTPQPVAPTPKKESTPAAAANQAAPAVLEGRVVVAANPGAGAVAYAVPTAAGTPDPKAEVKPVRPDVEAKGEIQLSPPLDAKSDDYRDQTEGELKKRLASTGLNAAEVELLISLYRPYFFDSDEAILLCRLPQSAIDEMAPLVVEPDATKILRTALVLVRKVDPRLREQIKELIRKLGDPSYTIREEAQKSLLQLGSQTVPALKEALKDKDAEIVNRVERILAQNESMQDKK